MRRDAYKKNKSASTTDKTIFKELTYSMIKGRKYYKELFKDYPDVVTLEQFRQMLGGIGDSTARKLMRAGRVKHFYINHTYLIPKTCVIDYVLSEHYAEYKKSLKVQI